MKGKQMYILLVLLFSIAVTGQVERDQFVKWNFSPVYSVGKVNADEAKSFSKFSAILGVAVALSENDVHDAATIYLEPYLEIAVPVKNPYNNELQFQSYGGGFNFKRYFNAGNQKSRFYLTAGLKFDYLKWDLHYTRKGERLHYDIPKLDYVLLGGMGYTISDHFELFLNYSKGLAKVYAVPNLDDTMHTAQYFSFGFRVNFDSNWWYSPYRKRR